MKFGHMADIHLGAWRDPKMKLLPLKAFEEAVNISIKEKVDFVLIAGDFLNTSLPGIDIIQFAVKQLRRLQEKEIPVYIIPGSHDFSNSGKTMLNVMEEAGMIINVCKGEVVEDKLRLNITVDEKTGAKLTGILGRRGTLEKSYYEDLDRESLEKEEGEKVFLFHSAIDELKPKKYEKVLGAPASYLPKGFDYYAGGHVHIIKKADLPGYKNIVYPGPIFPASFSELEDLENGGFYIYDNGKVERKNIILKNVFKKTINAENKSSEEISLKLEEMVKNQEFIDMIVLIRVKGTLSAGRISDIDFKSAISTIYEKGAYFVMKSTSQLTTREFKEVKIDHGSAEDIEERIIKEHLGQVNVSFSADEEKLTKSLMKALSREQDESEKKYEYEERVKDEAENVLEID